MRYRIAVLGLGALLSGCMSSPAEFYGIRQAVPEQREPAHFGTGPLHTAATAVTGDTSKPAATSGR